MKYIQKSLPDIPPKLLPLKKWADDQALDFASLNGTRRWKKLKREYKQMLQDTLIEEQGYVCAYCNRPIHKGLPEDDQQLRIDHLQPKDKYPDKTFDYYNLVGCCFGDEKDKNRQYPPWSRHCDVSKEEKEIPQELVPTNSSCENVLRYTSEGEIITSSSGVQYAIDKVLNLNCTKLTIGRKNAITAYTDIELKPEEAYTLINKYKNPDSQGRLEPFCGAIIGFLRQNHLTNLS